MLSKDIVVIVYLMFNKDITILTQLTSFLKATYRDLNQKVTV